MLFLRGGLMPNLIIKRLYRTPFLMKAHTYTPTVRVEKSDFGFSFISRLPECDSSADTGSDLCLDNLSRPYLSASVPKADFSGSRKRSFSAILQHSEQLLPNVCVPREGFSRGDPVDSSGSIFSVSVSKYDPEASFESHHNNSRYFSEGKINSVTPANKSSPSVQKQSAVGDISVLDASTICNAVQMKHPQLEELPVIPNILDSDPCLGKLEPLDRVTSQSENSHAVQDATTGPLPLSNTHSCSQCSFSDEQFCSVDKLLSSYILYNKDCFEHKIPFLEFWHSQNCGDNTCSCGKDRMVLSHFDTCGSSDCRISAPFLKAHGNDFGDTDCSEASEDNMVPAKYRKLMNASSVKCGSFNSNGFSGPLKFEPRSPAMVTSHNPEATKENVISHADDPTKIDQVDVNRYRPADGVSVDFQENSAKPLSPCELKDTHADSSCELKSILLRKGSPAMVTSHNPEADKERVISHADNPARIDQVDVNRHRPSEGISVDFQENSAKPVSSCELKDTHADSFCDLIPDSVPGSCDDEKIDQDEEGLTRNHSEIIELKEESSLCSIASLSEMKSEKQKVEGISLIDCFTAQEIREHISSLRQKVDQVRAEEVVGIATCSVNENLCQLCAYDRLSFPPTPIYCSACGARVKNYQSYYSTKDDRAQFCFCSQCYHRRRAGSITFLGFSISKNNLEVRKNDLVTEESWVQCDKCEGWQHQICALFNDRRDLGGEVEYICPKCHLDELGTKEGKPLPLPRTTSLDAINLPQTLLSDHLEERLFRRLDQEREERAKAAGKNPDEVPQPADLVIRVVSSVDKSLKVKQQFLDIFPEKNYPSEFPYRSKVILLFQRIEGVDVCLFAMYVQEFGSECSLPNQRCVYVSYLDSVKYFRPEMKTLKGEALRTFVYHEILVGYLDYCKKRGFATCYIWACPPVKGEDYILYCHPETQKTPRPDKLRQWYQTMLKKATEEKVVINFSNLYEKFFVPNGESNTKVTAARLPYFDGDYWSGVAENMIKKIETENGGDPEKQIKKLNRRSLKAMGHSNPSAHEAKDILLMQALAQSISSAKEDFIIVYLQSICSHCHEVILSGKRWFCNQCKNYQLCQRCHQKELYSGEGETHISSSGKIHALCQETVDDVPVDTEDNDAVMKNCFLENRHAFLNFCQGNHYQFDSLRRAKHSSMMVLYHLHNPNEASRGATCSLCLKFIGLEPKWTCDMCPDLNVCIICYQRNNTTCHSHSLIRHPPVITAEGSKVAEMVSELLNALVHASRCKTTKGCCSYLKCTLLKRLFSHAHSCSIRASGGCRLCRKTWFILLAHSRRCKDTNCCVPRCIDLKERASKLEAKSHTGLGKALPYTSGRPNL